MDYMKRHTMHKAHLGSIAKLRRLRCRSSINNLLTLSTIDREMRSENSDRQRSTGEQVKILIDNVLLASSMNASMLVVQDIHEHLSKYVTIPESWHSKNYAFEFFACINAVVQEAIMSEIR